MGMKLGLPFRDDNVETDCVWYWAEYLDLRESLKVAVEKLELSFVYSLESLPGDQSLRLRTQVVLLSPSTQLQGQCLLIGHGRFFPHPLNCPFTFITLMDTVQPVLLKKCR
jgi:hypothetical protein